MRGFRALGFGGLQGLWTLGIKGVTFWGFGCG